MINPFRSIIPAILTTVIITTLAANATVVLFEGFNVAGGETANTSSLDNIQMQTAPVEPVVLKIRPGSTGVILSWPATVPNHILQSTDQLPSTSWQAVTNAPAVVSNEFTIIVEAGTAQRFYRLQIINTPASPVSICTDAMHQLSTVTNLPVNVVDIANYLKNSGLDATLTLITNLMPQILRKSGNGLVLDYGDGYTDQNGSILRGSGTMSTTSFEVDGDHMTWSGTLIPNGLMKDGASYGVGTVAIMVSCVVDGTKVVGDITGTVTNDVNANRVTGSVHFDTMVCPNYPVSGSVEAKVAGQTHIFTFTNSCDGSFDYKETGSAPAGMVLIPAGSFTMGDTLNDQPSDSLEHPTRTITVSAFYMDAHLVTQALWDEVYSWAISQDYSFDNRGRGKGANYPVYSMSWHDAVKWCNARSQKAGLTPVYYTDAAMTQVYKAGQVLLPFANWAAKGYRLPTEAEWEYAARGGLSGKRFPWGDTISHTQANYDSSTNCIYDVSPTRGHHPDFGDWPSPYTVSPVDYFAANGYGLHDMAGNLWQWCWDWYNWYVSGPQTDPRGPASGGARVHRGGSYEDEANFCRVAFRGSMWPEEGSWLQGFRCVLPGAAE